jgi:uncharacterized protein
MTVADTSSTRVRGGPVPARAGIGLRAPHHAAVIELQPDVGWLEVHTENYFHDGGPQCAALERVREHFPLSLHGVGLALGSVDPLDREHLERVRRAVDRYQPALVSEHASWGSESGEHFNDLLPLPYTEEAVEHLAARVRQVQDVLGRQILVENLSSYFAYRESRLTEWQFLSGVVERSGCGLLVDVNNAYVNSINLGLDAEAFLAGLPRAAVQEIHLAGHTRKRLGDRDLLIDDHGSTVCAEVWRLYDRAIARFGTVPTLIEWDTGIPALEVLVSEAHVADAHLRKALELAA